MGREPRPEDFAALREALRKVKQFVPPKKILAHAVKLKRKDQQIFSDRALRAFIADEATGGMNGTSFGLLANAWLYSPVGHVLRHLDNGPPTAFAELIGHLGDGGSKQEDGLAVDGAYFMYHGSYLRPGHLVIRVITIKSGDDHVIAVTDTVRDSVTLGTRDRVANGVMAFHKEHPQILLWGQENKQGLSLIIGSQIEAPGKVLNQMSGAFIVMRPGGDAAYRRCLFIREPEGEPRKMLEHSSIFPAKEIDLPERQRHKAAFAELKKGAGNEVFPDPVLTYDE